MHDARAVVLRPAVAEDYDAVAALLRANALPVDGVSDLLGEGFVVAVSADEVVGVVGVEYRGAYGLLRSAAVDASRRGGGIGHQLVSRAIADAEQRGITALFLLTTTAEKWFPAFGFAVVARADVPADIRTTDEFVSACPASATVMRRDAAQRV